MDIQNKKSGFTIIEVVLVLAIAALIFLMVFIALPALQRSQRDTARRNDVSIVSAGVNSYTSNNQGRTPNSVQLRTQVGNEISNNTVQGRIVIRPANTQSLNPGDGSIQVAFGRQCGTNYNGGNSFPLVNGSNRQYAVATRLEAAGGSIFCQSN